MHRLIVKVLSHRTSLDARKQNYLGGSTSGLKVAMGTDRSENSYANMEYGETKVELLDSQNDNNNVAHKGKPRQRRRIVVAD